MFDVLIKKTFTQNVKKRHKSCHLSHPPTHHSSKQNQSWSLFYNLYFKEMTLGNPPRIVINVLGTCVWIRSVVTTSRSVALSWHFYRVHLSFSYLDTRLFLTFFFFENLEGAIDYLFTLDLIPLNVIAEHYSHLLSFVCTKFTWSINLICWLLSRLHCVNVSLNKSSSSFWGGGSFNGVFEHKIRIVLSNKIQKGETKFVAHSPGLR